MFREVAQLTLGVEMHVIQIFSVDGVKNQLETLNVFLYTPTRCCYILV